MRAHFFITATDTDAGKTWVTRHLIHGLLQQGIQACAIKPIACGMNASGINEDVATLREAQHDDTPVNLYSFRLPAAPIQAAAAEHTHIQVNTLQAWCEQRIRSHAITLIEGIGGLMVPLTTDYLVADWLNDLPQSQVILVVGAKLGCINHALLTLHHLHTQQRAPAYVIINDAQGGHDLRAIQQAITPYLHPATQVVLSPYQQADPLTSLATTLAQSTLGKKSPDNEHP